MRSFQVFGLYLFILILTCVNFAQASSTIVRDLKKSIYHHKVHGVQIYQYDDSPLGNREPLLFVHGWFGENKPYFRYDKVIRKFQQNPEIVKNYKIYLLRYNSNDELKKTIPYFQEKIDKFYSVVNERPISIIALSLGGNLVYESMLDSKTDSKIKILLAMGTPFHGSPLFCPNWMKYMIYKNYVFPPNKIDLNIAYSVFFKLYKGLITDLRWDNCDAGIPEVGKFKSWVPFGPKGNLTINTTENFYLNNLNKLGYGKNKIIAYAGYTLNEFMLPTTERYIKSTITLPYSIVAVYLPAFFARERAVLKLLNASISQIDPQQELTKFEKTRYVYQLNDGITPLNSALFIPADKIDKYPTSQEGDIHNFSKMTDVKIARIFRNIDHLTFISGQSIIAPTNLLKDELHPELGKQSVFDWMIMDLIQYSNDEQLAKVPNIGTK